MALTSGAEMYGYYNSNTWASPTWVLLDQIVDLNKTRSRNKIEVKNRASTFKRFLAGLKEYGITFGLTRDDANTAQTALDAAYEAATLTSFAFANGPIATTGTKYVKAEFIVTKFDDHEPLEGGTMIDVELSLGAKSAQVPTAVTV